MKSKIISSPKLEETLRIAEAARLLGVSTMTLRRWDGAGILKAVRFGKRKDRRYKKADILEILEKGLQ